MERLVLRDIYKAMLDKKMEKDKKKQLKCKHKKVKYMAVYYYCKRCGLIEWQNQYDNVDRLKIDLDIFKP